MEVPDWGLSVEQKDSRVDPHKFLSFWRSFRFQKRFLSERSKNEWRRSFECTFFGVRFAVSKFKRDRRTRFMLVSCHPISSNSFRRYFDFDSEISKDLSHEYPHNIVSKFAKQELRADVWPGMFCGHCGEGEREGSAIITPLPGRRRHYHFLRHHRREREDGSDETWVAGGWYSREFSLKGPVSICNMWLKSQGHMYVHIKSFT